MAGVSPVGVSSGHSAAAVLSGAKRILIQPQPQGTPWQTAGHRARSGRGEIRLLHIGEI